MDAKEWRVGDVVRCVSEGRYYYNPPIVGNCYEIVGGSIHDGWWKFKGEWNSRGAKVQEDTADSRDFEFVRRPTSESEPVQPAPVILMLPKAKAMFRERQFAIRAAQTRARLDAEDLAEMARNESYCMNVDTYSKLVGRTVVPLF